ncbi:MAG TPA: pyridoxal-phosphate dependent enzyme [Pseudonocardia sp.]|jgi:threonine dehydratase|nr:pyridoxal-phosphate dependent enzyme [Pseudonocardia sp.]
MDLSLDRISRAIHVIDPAFLNSPQYVDEELSRHLGSSVTVKVETVNPVRSFKGRGTYLAVAEVSPGTHVVCSSTGNFGQGVAFAARSRGLSTSVFVPDTINPVKRARMEAFGATVIPAGPDATSAQEAARAFADGGDDRVFLQDGLVPAIAEGAGTIGLELVGAGPLDAVVVPVGDGALISGIGLVLKAHRPETRIIGVTAAGAQAMHRSFISGRAVTLDRADTIAEGLMIRSPIPESVARVLELADDFVVVNDDDLLDAMTLAASTIGVLLEPAGAAGIAAIAGGLVAGERVATILTGANPSPDSLAIVHARLAEAARGAGIPSGASPVE